MNVLNKRYNNNSIYTFNGNILISKILSKI